MVFNLSSLACAKRVEMPLGSDDLGTPNEINENPSPETEPEVVSPTPPSPPPTTPPTSTTPQEPSSIAAYFTRPDFKGDKDLTITREIIKLFDGAVPGSLARASLYKCDDLQVAAAIARAYYRGVDVKIVLDNSFIAEDKYKEFGNYLLYYLGTRNVHICKTGGCIGRSNNHNKFYVFEKTLRNGKYVNNLVAQTSQNMADSQVSKFQDLIIMTDQVLFSKFLNYWQDLRAQLNTHEYTLSANGTGYSKPLHTKVYFFPTQGPDPLLEDLKAANCSAGGQIALVQSIFKNSRARKVLQQLKRLRNQGCKVALVVRKNSDDNDAVELLKNSNLNVTFIKDKHINIHSKFVLINAKFKNKNGDWLRRKLVYTGSANLQDKSLLSNDETMLLIEKENIFNQFKNQFIYITKHADDGGGIFDLVDWL